MSVTNLTGAKRLRAAWFTATVLVALVNTALAVAETRADIQAEIVRARFAFFIRDTQTSAILFAGRVLNPNEFGS